MADPTTTPFLANSGSSGYFSSGSVRCDQSRACLRIRLVSDIRLIEQGCHVFQCVRDPLPPRQPRKVLHAQRQLCVSALLMQLRIHLRIHCEQIRAAEPTDTIFVNKAAPQRPPKLGHEEQTPQCSAFEDLTPVTAMKLSQRPLSLAAQRSGAPPSQPITHHAQSDLLFPTYRRSPSALGLHHRHDA